MLSLGLVNLSTALVVFATLCGLAIRDLLARRARRLKTLPPGPPGLPVIGNYFDLPSELEWITYNQWANEYGKIVYVENMGQSIVILNSLDVATEIFERRSTKYSCRPDMVMVKEILGLEWVFAFMPYGNRWRQHRKVFHLAYHPKAVERFFPAQQTAVLRLARSLLETPERFMDHIIFFGAYVILNTTYGYRPENIDDYYVKLNVKSQELLNENGHQMFLVEIFPFLKRLPPWFPGAGFKKVSAIAQAVNKSMINEPFNLAKAELLHGNPDVNFAHESLSKLEEKQDPTEKESIEEVIRNSAAIAYLAGGETTTTSIEYFLFAMLLYPEAQKKAQLELDTYLEGKRLPEFSDTDHLPYIKALVSETMRWHPVTPLGVQHSSTVDDVYEGYHIPKGSIIVGNVWAILHDPKLYGADHLDFNPERFLPKAGQTMPPDPSIAAFGFGRRICPGRYMALNNLWITIATLLTIFDIRKALDENGNEIEPSREHISGMIVKPVPFGVRFVPRSEASVKLLQAD